MATRDQVFSPNTGATTGLGVKVTANNTPTSVSGSIPATSTGNTIRVANTGTVLVFVRITNETSPTATGADIPLGAGKVETFASPGGRGVAVGVAVLSSTTTACDVYFCPGEGVASSV